MEILLTRNSSWNNSPQYQWKCSLHLEMLHVGTQLLCTVQTCPQCSVSAVVVPVNSAEGLEPPPRMHNKERMAEYICPPRYGEAPFLHNCGQQPAWGRWTHSASQDLLTGSNRKDTGNRKHVGVGAHTMFSLLDFFSSSFESKECWEKFASLASGMRRHTLWFVFLHSEYSWQW